MSKAPKMNKSVLDWLFYQTTWMIFGCRFNKDGPSILRGMSSKHDSSSVTVAMLWKGNIDSAAAHVRPFFTQMQCSLIYRLVEVCFWVIRLIGNAKMWQFSGLKWVFSSGGNGIKLPLPAKKSTEEILKPLLYSFDLFWGFSWLFEEVILHIKWTF